MIRAMFNCIISILKGIIYLPVFLIKMLFILMLYCIPFLGPRILAVWWKPKKMIIKYFKKNPVGKTSDVSTYLLENNINIGSEKLMRLLNDLDKSGKISYQDGGFWLSNYRSAKRKMKRQVINLD